MKDAKINLETSAATYPLVFNLNVIDLIQEKYHDLDKWMDVMQGTVRDKNGNIIKEKTVPSLKDIKWFLKEVINEGIDIENEQKNEKRSFINERQAGRIITEISIEEVLKKTQELTVKSTMTDKQLEEQKNV